MFNMEEIQSTETLDREILEDARKKSLKILKSAGESVSASKAAWDKKLEQAAEKIRKGYAQKTEEKRREITTRLPLDKRRIRLTIIDRFLNKAMEDFLLSLDRPSLLGILERELSLRAAEVNQSEMSRGMRNEGELRYGGLSREECSALVSQVFPGQSFTYIASQSAFPALVINFSHARITVSIEKAAEDLLLDKRAELTGALLGNNKDIALDLTLPEKPEAENG